MAAVLAYDGAASRSVHENSCSAALEEAGGPLLDRAVRSGQVRATVTVHDLVALAVGVTLATEGHSDPGERARRLFEIVVEGISPNPGPPHV